MKILLIKSSSLGDIIHAYDLIVYLKKKFPFLQLDWVAERFCAPLVERHPYVNRTYIIDSKLWPRSYLSQTSSYHKEKYDLIIDLQGNIKSSLLLARAKGKEKLGFGWSTLPEWPNFFFTTKRFNPPKGQNIRQDYLFLVQRYFQDFTPVTDKGPLLTLSAKEEEGLAFLPKEGVIVAPYSRWPNKEVGEEKILSFLKNEERIFLLWKGERERKCAEQLQARLGERATLLPELSLPLLQHLLAQSKEVICTDSLVLHLAATTSTPTVSFFGPSNGHKYAPLGEKHIVYQGKCPFGQTFEKRCPYLRSCLRPKCSEEQKQVR